MPAITQDIRFALRQLRRSPVFSLVVMGTIALAVGAAAAMSGILRASLLHPLPYPHPEQLVQVGDQNLRGFKTNGLMTVLRTDDLAQLTAEGRPLFSSLGFFYSDDSTLTLVGQTPLRVPAAAVSGTFFQTIATPALLGRTLVPADDVPKGPQLVVLSYRLWESTFAADPAVLGRTVRLGADQATIVGVMPPSFALPASADLWHPGHIFPKSFRGYRGDGSRFLQVIGRLDPSISLASARVATTLLAVRLGKTYPETDSAWGFTLIDLRTALFGNYRQALLLLSAAIALVLLAAAVNIAGLQLSRNAARQGEFAIRAALGISRGRLASLLAVEALTPVLAGGIAGLTLGAALLRLVVSRLPADGGWPHMQFALRFAANAAADATLADTRPGSSFQARIRSIVTGLDSSASPGHFTTLSNKLDSSLSQPRLNAALLSAFGGLALLLVVIGVYGLVAFEAAQRTRELALRLALGATRGGILRLLLAESTGMLAIGLTLGVGASVASTRALSAATSTLAIHTPALLLLLASTLLAAAVLVATFLPARRAAQVDPMQALRSE